MISKTFTRRTGIFLILAAIFSAGCSSMNKPDSASFATVIIANKTIAQIQQATLAVFQQNGYTAMTLADGSTGFQREATKRETISYAGIVGAHDGDKVLIRVETTITGKGAYAYRLSCKAFAITGVGQGIFENSTALFGFQSGQYQDLLDQVAAQAAKMP